MTAPAIYLIETGRTRPSLPTLEHIAKRTGKPIEFFMAAPVSTADEGRWRLLQLEAMVEDRRNEEAIALGLSMLARTSFQFQLGRIRFFLAYAYARTGQRQQAASFLSEAKAHFEAINDSLQIASCVVAEAEFNIDTNPKQAVALAQAALALARGLTPRTLLAAARIRGVLADAQAASGDLQGAIASYRDAIRFNDVFDLRTAARTYTALGLAVHDAGDLENAVRYTLRATALFAVVREREAVIGWEHRLARTLIAGGDLIEGRAHLDRALELLDRSSLEKGRADVQLALCELAMKVGNVDQAAGFAQKALAQAERVDEASTVAEARVWLGQIADRRGDIRKSNAEFEQAIKTFESLNLRERLLHVHSVYAEVLEGRGEHAKGYDHMKHALRLSRPALTQREQAEEDVGTE